MAGTRRRSSQDNSDYRKLRRPAVSRSLAGAKELLARTTKEAMCDPYRPMTRSEVVADLFDWIESAYVERRSWEFITRILRKRGVTIGVTVLPVKFREERKRRDLAAAVPGSPATAIGPEYEHRPPAATTTDPAQKKELDGPQPVHETCAKRDAVSAHELRDARNPGPEPPPPGKRNIVTIRNDL